MQDQRDVYATREWFLQYNLLYYFHIIYIFDKTIMKMKILCIHHDDSLIKHFEVKKTRLLLQRKLYWFKMLKDIKNIFKTAMFVNAWKWFVIVFMTRRRRFSYQLVLGRKFRWTLLSSFSLIVIKTIYTMLYSSQSIVIRK